MGLGNFKLDGQMVQLTSHNVLYRQVRHTHTTSPSQAREELCYGMLTSHG